MDKKCGAKKVPQKINYTYIIHTSVVGSDKNTLIASQTAQSPNTIEKYNHTCTNTLFFSSQLLHTFFSIYHIEDGPANLVFSFSQEVYVNIIALHLLAATQ